MCILGSVLLILVEIDLAEVDTKSNEICSLRLNYLLFNCFLHLLHLFTFCCHTGDNVRLSDVVKFNIVFLI